MPGPRSKRKRAEIDASTTAPAPSRRRRDAATTGAELTRTALKNNGKAAVDDELATEGQKQATTTSVAPSMTLNVENNAPEEGNDHAEEQSSESKQQVASLVEQNERADDQENKAASASVDKEKPSGDSSTVENSNKSQQGQTPSREAKIRDLLEHRKMLLERLRQGRSAARKRLDIVMEKTPLKKDETDEQEIAAFREMARVATSLARKHARSESEAPPGEKRTSVSLRRGSSVGKRMNAALSSLAPGAAASAILQEQKASILPTTAAASATTTATAAVAARPPPAGGTHPSTAAVPPVTGRPGAAASKKDQARQAQTASSVPGRTVEPKNLKLPPNVARAAGLSAAAASIRAGAPSSSVGLRGASTLSSPPPPSRRAAKPRVVCPEAVALRERKKAIEAELSSLLKDRITRIEREKSHSQAATSTTTTAATTRDLSSITTPSVGLQQMPKEISPALLRAALKGPGRPSHLPPRRRTHWDYVLDEMRWLATDFIEERKWKISMSRTLGEAVKSRECCLVAAAASPSKVLEDADHSKTNGSKDEEKLLKKQDDLAAASADRTIDVGSSRGLRSYIEVTAEDDSAAVKVAKILSSMVLEFTVATENAGMLADSDHEYTKGLDRHQLTRQSIDAEETGSSVKKTSSKDSGTKVSDQNTTLADSGQPMDVDASGTEGSKPGGPNEKEKAFRRTSDYVDGVLQRLKKKPGPKSKASTKVQGFSTPLSSDQAKLLETIEDLWTKVQVGAILGGPISSGKTIVSCALLWKNRLDGPQLVVCSPSSMIRWMHEIGRFKGLRRLPIGFDAGISVPSSLRSPEIETEYEASDVVLCEYSAVSKLTKETLASFSTIMLDLRYPRGYLGSRAPICAERSEGGLCAESPSELTTSSWWVRLAELQANRLLIESPSPSEGLHCLSGLPDRQLLEILAVRVAFLFGASQFRSPDRSLQKSILAWARRKIKGSDETGTKFERVRKVLVSLADPFYCRTQHSKLLEDVSLSDGGLSWELRMCEMTTCQRSAYDESCSESRASLSANFQQSRNENEDRIDPFVSVGEVLLELRRLCIHANSAAVLSGSDGIDQNRDAYRGGFHMKPRDGPSQPNAELAARILEGSGKMRELLSILVHDCGMQMVEGLTTETIFQKESRKSTSKSKQKRNTERRKRVAIVASLPEAQMLVSLLLNSVGINHELLLRPVWASTGTGEGNSAIKMHSLSWAQSQLVLSRFNEESPDSAGDHGRSGLLVVASPETVAGDHTGLGVEFADVIVSLDEDWSGRSELLMKSLESRCLLRHETSRRDSCRFIKLVSADSCEERFLKSSSENAGVDKMETSNYACWPWRLDAFGLFTLPKSLPSDEAETVRKCWPLKNPRTDTFTFPGRNVFSLRGNDLSQVLATAQPLSPLLSSGSKLFFLPRADDEAGVDVEMDIVASLVRHEEAASTVAWSFDNDPVFHSSSIVPPHPLDFPRSLMSRLDLAVLPTRMYLERFCRDIARKQRSTERDGSSPSLPSELLMSGGAMPGPDGLEEADKWQKDTFDEKPEAFMTSILFYGANESPPRTSKGILVSEAAASGRRVNFYSGTFSRSSLDVGCRDGNSGSEALIYFPPLFPRMLECSDLARRDVESLKARLPPDASKRSEADTLIAPINKRPRLEPGATSTTEDGPIASKEIQPSSSLKSTQASDPRPITEDEASHSDAASVLLDLADDYGLAGIGAVPLPRDSALAAAGSVAESTNGPWNLDGAGEWMTALAPCDPEEMQAARFVNRTNMNLDSMILFASRKRPRGFAGLPGQTYSLPHQEIALSGSQWGGGGITIPTLQGGVSNELYHDVNGTGRKARKKGTGHKERSGVSAFNRLATNDIAQHSWALSQVSAGIQLSKTKDSYRTRLAASQRGATLFEAPQFRAASVRIRNRITERLQRHPWTSSTAFEVGPGLPLFVSKQPPSSSTYRGLFHVDPNLWTSIVKRLKTRTSVTGEEAVELSNAQRLALSRSLVAPCRVDFGPFQSGFLSSPSGTTAVAPPRSRHGVSLPMGVKFHVPKDQTAATWKESDDQLLHQCACRFGMNWVLSARVLSGFQDAVIVSREDQGSSHFPRAARSCRDRWQSRVRTQPYLAKEVSESERAHRSKVFMSIKQITTGTSSCQRIRISDSEESHRLMGVVNDKTQEYLMSSASTDDSDSAIPPGETKEAEEKEPQKPRRSFAAFDAAKSKKEVIPMSIPGVVSGSQPSVVPSHPSHMQSVQSSVASSYTSGRTEMWPLQLLDAADRKRAAVAAATGGAARPPSGSSSSRSHSKTPPMTSSSRPSTSSGPIPASQRPPPSVPAPPNNAAVAPQPANAQRTTSQSRSTSSSIQSFIPPSQPSPAAPSPSAPQTPTQSSNKSS